MTTKTVEVTKQPNKYVTVTQKKVVSTVTDPADQTIEIHDPGVAGPANNLTIGTVTVADTASASITGISPNQVLNLVYPASVRHVHTQGTASTSWSITHALGGYPSVSIVDSAKTVVIGEVTYLSTTQVVVNFTSAFSGYAYLT
jgi:hypothetical protein